MGHSHSHDHDHGSGGHSHSHAHSHSAANRKALWWVLLLTAGYLVAEVIGGILSGSLALIADAGHMALDVAAVALGLFASWVSARPPTPTKTYGYYRAEILAALLNGITLVIVSLWIFYEAYERFGTPPEVKGGLMAIVAAGGLLVNVGAMWLMHSQKEAGLNMQGVWLHLLTDALGSVSAIIGGLLVWQFNWQLADPIISVLIGVLILFGAWKLLVECVDVLMVSVPRGVDTQKITSDVQSLPQVIELHDLHVWALNTGVIAMSAHVKMEQGADYGEILSRVSDLLREKHGIEHVTLQLEPAEFEHAFCAPGKGFAPPGKVK